MWGMICMLLRLREKRRRPRRQKANIKTGENEGGVVEEKLGEERMEGEVSATLKSKQGNECRGSLQDGR